MIPNEMGAGPASAVVAAAKQVPRLDRTASRYIVETWLTARGLRRTEKGVFVDAARTERWSFTEREVKRYERPAREHGRWSAVATTGLTDAARTLVRSAARATGREGDVAHLMQLPQRRRLRRNPPSWVTDEKAWARAERAVRPRWDEYDEPWAVVAYVYKQMTGYEPRGGGLTFRAKAARNARGGGARRR